MPLRASGCSLRLCGYGALRSHFSVTGMFSVRCAERLSAAKVVEIFEIGSRVGPDFGAIPWTNDGQLELHPTGLIASLMTSLQVAAYGC